MEADLLVFSPHPDDAELGVGGTIIKHARQGYRVVLVDLTRGELASRGTPELRAEEATKAATFLGVSSRTCLDLGDGLLGSRPEQMLSIIEVLRQYRPRLVLAPWGEDRHPDHEAAHQLVRRSIFFSGVHTVLPEGPPAFRPSRVLYYTPYYEPRTPPACVVDVTETFDRKKEALRCFASQFYRPEESAPETWVSSEGFQQYIETRAAFWGAQIGVRYGEPLYSYGPLPLNTFALLACGG